MRGLDEIDGKNPNIEPVISSGAPPIGLQRAPFITNTNLNALKK